MARRAAKLKYFSVSGREFFKVERDCTIAVGGFGLPAAQSGSRHIVGDDDGARCGISGDAVGHRSLDNLIRTGSAIIRRGNECSSPPLFPKGGQNLDLAGERSERRYFELQGVLPHPRRD